MWVGFAETDKVENRETKQITMVTKCVCNKAIKHAVKIGDSIMYTEMHIH